MKIKQEHLAHLRDALQAVVPRIPGMQAVIAVDPRVRDPNKRLRWDCLYAAGLSTWLCDELYPYMNDENIDTAMRSLMPGLLAQVGQMPQREEPEPAARAPGR